jgi:flagellar hook-associated protein 3 FlgL
MRATEATRYGSMLAALQGSNTKLGETQERIASGKRLQRYSDGPVDAANALYLRAEESDLASYAKAAEDAMGWLTTQDGVLQSASSIMQRVRELVIAAGNASNGPQERETIATELEGLRDQLLTVVNTKYVGRSVFGGFAPNAVSQVAGTWTWQGDGGQINRRIGSEVVVQANIDGAAVFGFNGPPGTDLFSTLDTIAGHVRTGDQAVTTVGLGEIEARTNDILNGLAVVGARSNLIESVKGDAEARTSTLKQQRSTLEDVDVAQAALELAQAESGYRATLAAASRLQLPTLIDFLR